jgi:hypothetical protein
MSGHVKTNQELNASQKSVVVLTEPVNKQLSANAASDNLPPKWCPTNRIAKMLRRAAHECLILQLF